MLFVVVLRCFGVGVWALCAFCWLLFVDDD